MQAKWVQAIHQDAASWCPKENTCLCSKHFWPHDFQDSCDSNQSKKRQREEAGVQVRQTLKATEIPSRFPNLPSYMSRVIPAPRKQLPQQMTDWQRRRDGWQNKNYRVFFEAGRLKTYQDLVKKQAKLEVLHGVILQQ